MTVRFDENIKEILRQINKRSELSSESTDCFNEIIQYAAGRIISITNTLKTNEKTLTAASVKCAVKLFFKGELAKHANFEGYKAKSRFNNNAKKTGTRESKANLVISITKVEKMITDISLYSRKSQNATVHLAAVLEYICAEILELANKSLTPSNIARVIYTDDELKETFADLTNYGYFSSTQK